MRNENTQSRNRNRTKNGNPWSTDRTFAAGMRGNGMFLMREHFGSETNNETTTDETNETNNSDNNVNMESTIVNTNRDSDSNYDNIEIPNELRESEADSIFHNENDILIESETDTNSNLNVVERMKRFFMK